MYIFKSKYLRPVLVVKTHKTDRDGNNIQEPKYVRFEDKLYRTNDEEIADYIRHLINFNTEYFEISEDEIPNDAGYRGHSVGIAKMESSNPVSDKRMDILEAQISALTGLVSKLAENLSSKPQEVVETKEEDLEGNPENKLDKRSKEYKESLKSKQK